MKRIFLMSLLTLFTSIAQSAELTITVGNVQTNEGHIRVTIYPRSASDNFPYNPEGRMEIMDPKTQKLSAGMALPAKTGNMIFKADLPAGAYAVATFHDKNNNKELDTSFLFGIPQEPYGFSNDARGSFGPAEFEEAEFTIGEQGLSIGFDVN